MSSADSDKLTIGALAQAAGVNVETVRYYQRQKLLPIPPRRAGAFRDYNREHVRRLRFIRRAQALGFSLQEIARLLSLERERSCASAQALATAKLALIRERLADLRKLESALRLLVGQCAVGGRITCPIIATLSRDGDDMPSVSATHARGSSGLRRSSSKGA